MKSLSANEFAKLIAIARKRAKLSQANLAALSGVGIRFVRELEKGKPTCQLEKALLVARVLGIQFHAYLPLCSKRTESKDFIAQDYPSS